MGESDMKDILNNAISSVSDDKIWVIISAAAIAIFAMIYLPDPVQIVSNVVTGLFGVAVGRGMK